MSKFCQLCQSEVPGIRWNFIRKACLDCEPSRIVEVEKKIFHTQTIGTALASNKYRNITSKTYHGAVGGKRGRRGAAAPPSGKTRQI